MPDQTPSMPPLPKPWDLQHDDDGRPQVIYTADQMRAYAQAVADERVREALERAAQICDDESSVEGIAQRCRDAIRALIPTLSLE